MLFWLYKAHRWILCLNTAFTDVDGSGEIAANIELSVRLLLARLSSKCLLNVHCTFQIQNQYANMFRLACQPPIVRGTGTLTTWTNFNRFKLVAPKFVAFARYWNLQFKLRRYAASLRCLLSWGILEHKECWAFQQRWMFSFHRYE